MRMCFPVSWLVLVLFDMPLVIRILDGWEHFGQFVKQWISESVDYAGSEHFSACKLEHMQTVIMAIPRVHTVWPSKRFHVFHQFLIGPVSHAGRHYAKPSQFLGMLVFEAFGAGIQLDSQELWLLVALVDPV